jgi:hypothetical protein
MKESEDEVHAMTVEDAAFLTDEDIAYIRSNYRTLEELCADRLEGAKIIRRLIEDGQLPRASYVLPEGSEMYPSGYFSGDHCFRTLEARSLGPELTVR